MLEKIIEFTVSLVIAFLFGGLVNALQTRKQIQQISDEHARRMEKFKEDFVTRHEFDKEVERLRSDMREWVGRILSNIEKLGDKLDRIQGQK